MKAVKLCRLLILLFVLNGFSSLAQPKWTFEPFGKEKKPKEYEDKMLGSEKTASKKFTFFRRFLQNNVTHYNYYFNANNKINTVVEQAKLSQQEDFSKLLPFYPYSLEYTSAQTQDLDSVIYKSTAGILIHDLRTDWVDNLYLLIGKAYFFRKEFDSAALSFQFINANLFPRKKKDEGDRVIGGNEKATLGLSIADKEKRNLYQRLTQLPPSRNDALIWLTRTFIEQDKMGEAAGMISILQVDPNLPKRLKDDLSEVTAYWFYKQQMFDSSAFYLEKSLTNIKDKAERARQFYLLAQLYEFSGNYNKASNCYSSAAKKTPDALTDIFAHLNDAKMQREKGNIKELDKSISTLSDMARKDKYEAYRDIIYHSAGILSLNKPDTAQAVAFFNKSLSKNESNISYKNKVHLVLGKIDYYNRQYKSAADHYDSLDVYSMDADVDTAEVVARKENLRRVADQLDVIQKEDSLQMIAAMNPSERDALLKKISKKMKKELGETSADANEEESNLPSSFTGINQNTSVDLFDNNPKGEWYFYNAAVKSRGFNDFKSKWGKRENVDNWRRASAMAAANFNTNKDPMESQDANGTDSSNAGPLSYSYEALIANVPLTPEQMISSNQNIASALLELARIFELDLQDFEQAINTYEVYMQRFPDNLADGLLYLGLYHCYLKIGQTAKAEQYKNLLQKEFPDSESNKKITDPYALSPQKNNPLIGETYQKIYQLMIEGKYDESIKMKVEAEEKYGENFWTPQLLYMGAIYQLKCGSDSEAIVMLNNIVDNYPESLLREKASTLIEVVDRKWEIQQYLDSLQIVRAEEDEKVIIPDEKDIELNKIKPKDIAKPKLATIAKVDLTKPDAAVQLPPTFISGPFKWQPGKKHKVLMVLDRVDGVYVTEARTAFLRYNRQIKMDSLTIVKDVLDANRTLLIFGDLENAEDALQYFQQIKKSAAKEVPWLQANKYSFWIMTQDNINAWKGGGKIEEYKVLLDRFYPDKF